MFYICDPFLICPVLKVNKLTGTNIQKSQQVSVCHPAQIPKDTVLHIWKGVPAAYQKELSRITRAGKRVLLAAPWYINHISYGQDWRNYYTVQPQNFSGVCMVLYYHNLL